MLTFGNNIINASLNIPEQKLFFRSAQKIQASEVLKNGEERPV
jgi:hypothetical protein